MITRLERQHERHRAGERAEVGGRRQRRAAHALEDAAVAAHHERDRDARERREHDRRADQPGHEEVGVGLAVDVGVPAEQPEHEQPDRQHEGEDRGLAVAPEERAAPRRPGGRRAPPSRDDLLARLGRQLEVDVLEARPAHLEALELDALLERPAGERVQRLGRRVGSVPRCPRRSPSARGPADRAARRRPAGGSGSRRRRRVPSEPGAPSATIAAVAQHDHAVGERRGLVQVVRGQEHRRARVGEPRGSSPRRRGAPRGRSRSSARRGTAARACPRARAPGRAGGAGRPRACARAASAASSSPTSASSSAGSRGRG